MKNAVWLLTIIFISLNAIYSEALAQTIETKIAASDGAYGDGFGKSVAIDGDYAIIGAPYNTNSGSAYVFRRSGNAWQQMTKLTASDGAAGDSFGMTVGISGSYAIIGAPGDDDKGTGAGAAYIFHYNGSGWQQWAKLYASDGAAQDNFGDSVAIYGDYAIVGAYRKWSNYGAVYIFQRSGNNWPQVAQLTTGDFYSWDYFGASVGISGNYVIVGAPVDDDLGASSGSAYIFQGSGTNWTKIVKLTANDGATFDYFGDSVAISGDYAIVGAFRKQSYMGAAYIFQRNGNTWQQRIKLTASDAAVDDRFGWSVAISGNYAIVGSLTDDAKGVDSGSAYIFQRSGSSWQQVAKLTASDGKTLDEFGYAVAISNSYSITGAYMSDVNGNDSGSAYIHQLMFPESNFMNIGVFRASIGMWFLDRNGNGRWDDCVMDYCVNFGIQGDLPVTGDWNGDGTTKIGVFRPSIGWWFLDYNGNGQWDGCSIDRCYNFGISEDTPVTGDWNGDGKTEIGVFRKSIGWWFLDYNADGTWSGCSTDRCYNFGISIDTPVTGDWNGDGKTEIGVFRPSIGWWFVDVDGNGTWSGCGTDGCYNFGISEDLPVTGDWNGDGFPEIGVFRPSIGMWFLDYDGNHTWSGCANDRCYNFGILKDRPVTGIF